MRLKLLLLAGFLCSPSAMARDLVILTETGQERDGLPVLTRHPRDADITAALNRGLVARVVRLYSVVQRFREVSEGVAVEPAYLLLSSKQGGFPRYGFFLDGEEKRDVAYVDLHQSSSLAGRFGAVDQIFPHELGHIFIRQLIGSPEEGGSNQVHAIGLRTDRFTAFNEGFGEHFQVMALDDPDADPETALLASDRQAEQKAWRNLRDYRKEMEARWVFASPTQMRFLFWYSQSEDILRYHGVKANAFARRVPVPDHLYRPSQLYRAYLLQGVAVGEPGEEPKPWPIQLASEGVASHFFYRWMSHPVFREGRSVASVYEAFQVDPDSLSGLENAYLKLFYTFSQSHPPDLVRLIRSYRQLFAAEEPAMAELVSEVFGMDSLPLVQELWLANPDFQTGTTLFDQFRGLPRVHTFDINAASLVDLMGIPGMSLQQARQVLERAPFQTLSQLLSVPGLSPDLKLRLEQMEQEMVRLRTAEEEGLDLSLSMILAPFWQRALLVLMLATLLGAGLYWWMRKVRIWRAVLNGLAAAFVYLALGWILDGMAGWPALASTAIFWVPGAAWQLRRPGGLPKAASVVAAWILAALPAVALTRPWF